MSRTVSYLVRIARSLMGLSPKIPDQPIVRAISPPPARLSLPALGASSSEPLSLIRAAIAERRPVTLVHGRAGTGKTTLLRQLVATTNLEYVVLAPTGVAALNAGGQTIHSFFGIDPKLIGLDGIQPQNRLKSIVRRLDLVIIDEISMVRADLLDAVDQSLRVNRDCDEPFGGVPMLFVGDFLQLPPVVKRDAAEVLRKLGYESHFAFGAKCVMHLKPRIIELNKVYRQAEAHFVDLLGQLRLGENVAEVVEVLNRHCHRPHRPSAAPVILTARKQSAEAHNNRGLKALTGAVKSYSGIFTGKFSLKEGDQLPAPEFLNLKPGARVMLVKNDPDKRWVNGSLATVIKLANDSVHVRLDDNGLEHHVTRVSWENVGYEWDHTKKKVDPKVVGTYSQIPLIPAWAITIHKAQGLSLSDVRVDLGAGAFSDGQTYVALSRAKSLSGLSLANPLKIGDVRVHPELVNGIGRLVARSTS